MSAVVAPAPSTPADRPLPATAEIVVVGAGFAGIGMALRLREAGHRDVVVLERGADVGGTWRDNTYPGCACDIPSHLYSLSFRPNPDWTRFYSRQPEIFAYLQACVRDGDISGQVHLNCELTDARWDEHAALWRLRTPRGELTCRWLITATGPLSEPSLPRLPGLDSFAGQAWHSARWRHDVDLTGLDVAVVGTGASAIQFVPEIQPIARSVTVYQRSAPWIMPRGDRPIDASTRRRLRRLPVLRRGVRLGIFGLLELFVPALRGNRRWLAQAERRARAHLEAQVPDPVLRERLTPDYLIGCKRILSSDDYLPAVGQPNVELVTDSITEVTDATLRTRDGAARRADVIVFGTGFVVMEPPITHVVHGRHGHSLAGVWAGSPKAHRGTAVHGFPNHFMLLGPNTGLGHNSVVLMAEAQIGYVLAALRHAERTGARALEVTATAQADYNAWIDRRSKGAVWTSGECHSWYLDASGRNTAIWPGWVVSFRRQMRSFDADAYHDAGSTRQDLPAERTAVTAS